MVAAREFVWPPTTPIWRRVLYPQVRARLAVIAAVALAGLGSVGFSLAQPVVLERLISSFEAGVDYAAAAVLATLIMARTLIASVASYFGSRVANLAVLDLRTAMVGHVLRTEMSTYVRLEFGDVVHRLVTDAYRVRGLLPLAQAALLNTVTALGAFALMARIDWALTAVVLTVALACAVVYQRLSGSLAKVQEVISSRAARITSLVERTIGAVKSIRASAAEPAELARFGDAGRAEYRAMMKYARVAALLMPLTQVIAVAALIVAVTFGAWRVANGHVELGSFVAFVVLCFMFMDALSELVDVGVQTRTCLVSAERVGQVFALPTEAAAAGQQGAAMPVAAGPAAVAFEGVSYAYPDSDVPVLADVSFVAPAGGVTALVGASGSGKSTVLDLISRFYEPDAGRITVDGVDAASVPLWSTRADISYVEQRPYVFGGSLCENLLYGVRREADLEEIRQTMKSVRLEGLVEGSKDGFDAQIGERGSALSGGERQRLAIARALLQGCRIMLLDEITSELSEADERAVLEAVAALRGRVTIVMATHSKAAIEAADLVVSL